MSAYSDKVIADGAVAYWRLGETSGLTAVDIVGGKNGTISGGVTLGQAGALSDGDKAMAFDGTSGQIVTPSVTMGVACSIECWVKTNVPGNTSIEHPVLAHRKTAFDDFVVSVAAYWTPARFRVFSTYGSINGTRPIADNQWHHMVLVLSGTGMAMYSDGVLDISGTSTRPSVSEVLEIGFDTTGGGLYFPGSIDEVAIYPTALTAPQIAAHYAARNVSSVLDLNTRLAVYLRGYYSHPAGDLTTLINRYLASLSGDYNNRWNKMVDDATP